MKKYYSLIDKVYSKNNILQAFKIVKKNHRVYGISDEIIKYFECSLDNRIDKIHCELKGGIYKPGQAGEIELTGVKSENHIEVINFRDEIVQQAIRNIVEPIFKPYFNLSGYGYKSNLSGQKAIAKAERFINKQAYEYAVLVDLSESFDTFDYELIVESVNNRISDGKVLKLVSGFLELGILKNNEIPITGNMERIISPLLINIYMDTFDKNMENKEIPYVRYMNNILIFAESREAAVKYKKIVMGSLQNELKLKIDSKYIHTSSVNDGILYLGFILKKGHVTIQKSKIRELKNTIKKLTPLSTSIDDETIIKMLNPILKMWSNYFKIADCKELYKDLSIWIFRRIVLIKLINSKSHNKELKRKVLKVILKEISNNSFITSNVISSNSKLNQFKLFDISKVETNVLYHYYE